MITLKTQTEVEAIASAGRILAQLFEAMREHVRAGMTTGELDRIAEDFIRGYPGAKPAFKGLYGFPKSICMSVNEEVVHGIPNDKRVLKEGDILSFDAGVRLEGWYADAGLTTPWDFATGTMGAGTGTGCAATVPMGLQPPAQDAVFLLSFSVRLT